MDADELVGHDVVVADHKPFPTRTIEMTPERERFSNPIGIEFQKGTDFGSSQLMLCRVFLPVRGGNLLVVYLPLVAAVRHVLFRGR